MADMLLRLKSEIASIERLEVGHNIGTGDAAWDIVLYSEFASEAALEPYQSHPAHRRVAEWISRVRSDRAVVDYRC